MKDYVVVPLGEIIYKGYDIVKIKNAFKEFSCQREEDLENFLVEKAITYEKSEIGKTFLCKFYEKQGFKKLYNELNEENLYTLYRKMDFREYWSA